MIIEKTTGRSWVRQVHDRILRPLGMRRTHTPGTWPLPPRPHTADHQQFAEDGPLADTTFAHRPFSTPLSCGGSHLGHGGSGIGSRVLCRTG